MAEMKYLFLDMEWSQDRDFDVKKNQVLDCVLEELEQKRVCEGMRL